MCFKDKTKERFSGILKVIIFKWYAGFFAFLLSSFRGPADKVLLQEILNIPL